MQIQFLGDRADEFIPCLKAMRHEVEHIAKQGQIRECDLCLVSGYRFLIKMPYLQKPKKGIVAFHESDLPKGRGWACLNWTLLEGVPLTVSMFYIDEGVDSGKILAKKSCEVEPVDTVRSLRIKANNLIRALISQELPKIESGAGKPQTQAGTSSYWRKRTAADSELKGAVTPDSLWRHLRVCDNEHYPAFFYLHGKKVVLKYEVLDA